MRKKTALFSTALASAFLLSGCASIGSNAYSDSTGAILGEAPGCEEVFYFPSNERNDAMVKTMFGSTESGVFTTELEKSQQPREDSEPASTELPDALQIASCTPRHRFLVRHLDPGSYYLTSTVVMRTSGYNNLIWGVPTPGPKTKFSVSSAMQKVVVKPGEREVVTLPPEEDKIYR